MLPDEVQAQPSQAAGGSPDGRYSRRPVGPDAEALARAAGLVAAARRPVIVVGHGARAARAELIALAEELGAPVLTTFKAKGLVPDTHPLGAGVLGRSGTPVASWLMNEADLLLVVGASFSNHTGIAPCKPIVQVDDTPTAIGRFDAVTGRLLGDAALAVPALAAAVARPAPRPRTSAATSPSAGRSGGPRRHAARPTTAAAASRRRRSSRRCPSTCPRTPSSPSTSATTPTRSAATWSRRGSRC